MKDYTLLFEGVLTILFALITMYFIPWLKTKVSAEELADIIKWVKIAVQAAEMIYKESGMGEAKKAYVKTFLEDKGIRYDERQIDSLIESAVLELKGQFK
jgi:LL-H family phage holin